jgi:transposase-like protein
VSKRKRRFWTAEQKAALLRRFLVEKVPVSEICNEEDLQPSVFYDWLNHLAAQAHVVLAAPTRGQSPEKKLTARIAELEEKIATKDGVLAELLEEHVKLKKELGES